MDFKPLLWKFVVWCVQNVEKNYLKYTVTSVRISKTNMGSPDMSSCRTRNKKMKCSLSTKQAAKKDGGDRRSVYVVLKRRAQLHLFQVL